MCGSDVFCQVGAAGEQQLAVVPAAGVAQRLAPPHCCGSAARPPTVTIECGRGGAPAGRSAVHVHQGAADAGQQGGDVRTLTVHSDKRYLHSWNIQEVAWVTLF